MDIQVSLEGYRQYWTAGRELMNVQVTLGQDDQSSSCNIVLADPTGAIAADLIKHTLTQGGIVALPKKSNSDSSSTTIPTTSQPSLNGGTEASPKTQRDWTIAIVRECIKQGVKDRGQIAYMLATAYHESDSFKTTTEYDSGAKYEGRQNLGNTQPGDGVKFKGRGLVQVTGRANYTKYSKILKIDCVNKPELLAETKYALFTLVHGMTNGVFTGARLGKYVSGDRQDFFNARQVVNGYDLADKIAGYAKGYLTKVDKLLSEAGIATASITDKAEPAKANTTGDTTTNTTTEVVKGNKLVVSIDNLGFEFYHQGTETDQDGKTTLTGQGIRWVLNRRKRNKTLQNLKLSDLATKIAKAHGVKLDYQAKTDITYDHIDQSGLSDYQLLLRECKYAGLFVSESKGILTIKALANIQDTLLVLAPGNNLISWKVKDQAVDGDKEDKSSLLQDESKVRLNPVTGQFEQTKIDVDKVKDQSVTGKASDKPKGTVKPGQEAIADQARSRKKRVKGLPATFVVPLSSVTLTLEPLQAVRTTGLTGVLSRIWLIDSVSHDVAEGKTTLQCYSPIEVLDTSSPETPTQTTTNNKPTGDKNNKIYQAARELYGMSSAKAPGTNGGRVACVWAVNAVLTRAGVGNIWSSSLAVKQAKAAMLQAGYKITQAEAKPGDVALWDGSGAKQHIGIVMANGGASILSNSSSKATFTWTDTYSSYANYYGAATEFYRMK